MLENAILIALIVFFVKVTTTEGHIFEKVGIWAEANLPEKLYKPFIGCPICMSPWWGTLIYSIAYLVGIDQFKDISPVTVILTVFAAAGVNSILVKIPENESDNKED